ncbi:hypothetical protein TNCV_3973261 [Trichonephila clavipes]|nr:hypothetical protein TNCV_3973261 [Trichonephila clavipes]
MGCKQPFTTYLTVYGEETTKVVFLGLRCLDRLLVERTGPEGEPKLDIFLMSWLFLSNQSTKKIRRAFLPLSSIAPLLSLSAPSSLTSRTGLLHAPLNLFLSSMEIKSFCTRFSQTFFPTPLVLQGMFQSGPIWCHML